MVDVPFGPGVPPLRGAAAVAAIELLVADAALSFFGRGDAEWGLFKDGEPAVVADSVVSFDYKQDWRLSDYQVEEGAFETYNKVNTPFDVRLRLASGGSDDDRAAIIEQLEEVSNSTDLFDVVTPEKTYVGVNVAHVSYRRAAANGAGLILADVWCIEVRVEGVPTFSNTKQPSGASPVSGGTVQGLTPPAPLAASVGEVQ